MKDGFPRCTAKECAACTFDEYALNWVCTVLTSNYGDPRACPFYKERTAARKELRNAHDRAYDLGLYGPKGNYQGPRFTKDVTNPKTGLTETVADLGAWLDWLVSRDIITREFADTSLRTMEATV